MAVEHRPVDRRNFLRRAAAGTAGAASAALALPAASYARVPGSNAVLRVGFIGCGGRAQAHLHLVVKMAMDNRGVAPVAVCDVWDGLDEEYDHTFGGHHHPPAVQPGPLPGREQVRAEPGRPQAG